MSASRDAAQLLVNAIKNEITPEKIITRKSLENAIAVVNAIGGSTNAVLHLLAIAKERNIPLSIDDFEKIRKRVPVLCDMKRKQIINCNIGQQVEKVPLLIFIKLGEYHK